jgi:hypothetical protein
VGEEQAVPANTEVKRMKWAPWLFGSLTALMIASCGGERRDDTGAAGDAGTETGTMGEATDTTTPPATGGMPSDTARGGARIEGDTTQPRPGTSGAVDSVGDTARKTADSAAGQSH